MKNNNIVYYMRKARKVSLNLRYSCSYKAKGIVAVSKHDNNLFEELKYKIKALLTYHLSRILLY